MKKVEHIGIAVKDIEDANNIFAKLFNQNHYKVEQVQSEGVITSFFKIGETKIELLQGTHKDSPIAKFISKRGEGIHHIAFQVTDIDSEMDRLKSEGFELINSEAKDGADNKKIIFVHPKSTNGVLIELCQEKSS
ncbi:MAG: methylmalonyl-CoA epimerase [Flavobacteriales bacterium]|nr:methylmalonyl-CoA epimerase [Flavobacteriales bacterium]|tara:strand:+ start:4485 stop:4889 length:405 start_codon:yes stop_codon:yes gene_type:complete